MTDVTIVMAFYENAGMLRAQLNMMATYPDKVRERIRLIVVDDGSPTAPAMPPEGLSPVALSIYRMARDVRWNQDACRNLGVSRSKTAWLLLTDIDHMVPPATAERVTLGPLPRSGNVCYRFSRVSAPDMAPYKLHPNSYLMRRDQWDAIGGYDERFAGWYGTDGDFLKRVLKVCKVEQLPEVLIRVPREVIPDASTTTYARKTAEDSENITRIMRERDQVQGWRPLTLTQEWRQVC